MLRQPLENWKTHAIRLDVNKSITTNLPVWILRYSQLLYITKTIPFWKRRKCWPFSPRAQRGHKAADFPTVTHLQSVSLTGVCSHLISAHTLCLSPPAWGDGTPSARAARTHAHSLAHVRVQTHLFVAQRLQSWLLDSAYLSAARGQHDTDAHPLTFHQLQYRESLSPRYRSLTSLPEVLPRCVCGSVDAASTPDRLRGGISRPGRSHEQRQKRRQTWKRDNAISWKKEYLILLPHLACLCVCASLPAHSHTDKSPSRSPNYCPCVLTLLRKPPPRPHQNRKQQWSSRWAFFTSGTLLLLLLSPLCVPVQTLYPCPAVYFVIH